MLELANPEPRNPKDPEPRGAKALGLAPPSSEPPRMPSRRRPPNLTLDAPAPSPSREPAAPRPSRNAAVEGLKPDPLSRSDSRSRGLFPPASCLIAPWFAPGNGALTWLADQPTRRPSLRGPARRSAAATAYSTNGHSNTS